MWYVFGDFVLDTLRHELRHDDIEIPLTLNKTWDLANGRRYARFGAPAREGDIR